MKNFLITIFSVLALASCQSLPAAGPSAGDIFSGSSSKVEKSNSNEQKLQFEVVDVDRDVLAILSERHTHSFAGSFGDKGVPNGNVIGRGDQVQITIWEAGQGGIFSGENGASASVIPAQPVDSSGTITVPYAGRIKAAGRTPYQVKRTIETELEGKAIDPQVLVNVTTPVFNTVTVTGEASKGGRVPLSGRGDRLLDIIASVGGTSAPVSEISVQLTRGNVTKRVAMDRVVSTPSENIYMQPGDVVSLISDKRTVSVFGAAKKNVEVTLQPGETVLSETLARAGGLHDSLAKPDAVFIYRVEDASTVERMLPESKLAAQHNLVPVIYRVNLKDPSGFFIARAFHMADKDILYAATAPAVQYTKFTSLLNQTFATASGAVVTHSLVTQ